MAKKPDDVSIGTTRGKGGELLSNRPEDQEIAVQKMPQFFF
jgi:hypothetical protein